MEYKQYVGCHCFIDLSDGLLVINPNAKAYTLVNRNTAQNVMLDGMLVRETDKELIVTFDGGFNEFLYDKRYCKILPTQQQE